MVNLMSLCFTYSIIKWLDLDAPRNDLKRGEFLISIAITSKKKRLTVAGLLVAHGPVIVNIGRGPEVVEGNDLMP